MMCKKMYMPKNYTFVYLKENKLGALSENFIFCIPNPGWYPRFLCKPLFVLVHTSSELSGTVEEYGYLVLMGWSVNTSTAHWLVFFLCFSSWPNVTPRG